MLAMVSEEPANIHLTMMVEDHVLDMVIIDHQVVLKGGQILTSFGVQKGGHILDQTIIGSRLVDHHPDDPF